MWGWHRDVRGADQDDYPPAGWVELTKLGVRSWMVPLWEDAGQVRVKGVGSVVVSSGLKRAPLKPTTGSDGPPADEASLMPDLEQIQSCEFIAHHTVALTSNFLEPGTVFNGDKTTGVAD